MRTTGKDASGATVILSFPAGLVRFNDDGQKRTHSVTVRLEQRLVEATEWQEVETLEISAKKAEGFYRQHSWTFSSRAQWQVRATMMTDETDDSKKQQRTNWAALQTLRPEYPLNVTRPLALVALRIKATHQLNGALDNLSVLASRVCLDWDAPTETWINRATQNPASLYRHVLQAPENPRAVADAELDLEQIQNWHEFCAAKGLTYNAALSSTTTLLGDVLAEICAAGRATRNHDGLHWGVVVDQPTEDALIVDHISPRNAWAFSGSRSYVTPPDAFVVTFKDAGNDYKETQREIPWPGFVGDIEEVEAIAMPGKVYAAEVWREARRRQLEIIHRPDTFEATQDGALRVTTRGDHVMVNDYSLSRDHLDARVLQVSGNLLVIDELVGMEPDTDYAVRFRHFEDDEDTIGTSVVRLVQHASDEVSVLTLMGSGPVPDLRAVIQIGPATFTAHQRIITGIERTADGCSILRQVDAAPQIDVALDATEIPAWSSRVGAEIDDNLLQPSAPRFTSITSGFAGTDTADLITFLIAPGSGAISTASYEIDHRLSGGAWTTVTLSAGSGGGQIEGYTTGDAIELRARGVSATGIFGPYSTAIAMTVGAGDADIPTALDEAAITVTTLLGGALIQIATGDDAATTALQIYRSTSATLDRETDATGQPLAVEPQSTISTTLGDTTRENLVSGGAMTNAAAWDLDAGWAIAGGVATHTAGSSDAIKQAITATTGKYYRFGFTVAGTSAGTLTPRLTGGSTRAGTAITMDGTYSDRIQAVSGNDTVEFLASTDFDGSLDSVVAYLETSGCLDRGTHYIWIEPQNADGLPGPVSGPFEITII
ncbi:phage tail protein [Pacificibacter sp. 1_MG-2023]|uniref:TipJ family phage tail tip protein n=1 Tax=Pacificibacter sp. 1_MG-2023 TaxID=3062658 RepID=UPI0026E3E612|nr:phage tail protein [Pacificibacter sp. 1_MG-2023]MDO6616822.1 phage tail protein [Pacificibacter sp. 1_MG-2023]